jgi:hypothetical protein
MDVLAVSCGGRMALPRQCPELVPLVLLLNQMLLHLVQALSCLLLPLLCLMKLVLHVSLAFPEIMEQDVGLLTLHHLLVVARC